MRRGVKPLTRPRKSDLLGVESFFDHLTSKREPFMATWINFGEIRDSLDFRAVLTAYGVSIDERREGKHQGHCPLPTHSGEGRRPSFSADLAGRMWQCFGCKVGGNALDFAVRMEGLDPMRGADVRKVALQLKARFLDRQVTPPNAAIPLIASSPAARRSIVVNPPLDFELKGLDPNHAFFANNGFAKETVAHFGAGYCGRGLFKGRVALPLHDLSGQLVGYTGRAVSNEASASEPLYRYPEPRERAGVLHMLDVAQLVYNAHRLVTPVSKLIVVDDYLLAWHFWELGAAVVAIAPATPSPTQLDIIRRIVAPGGITVSVRVGLT
jgi:hypothetical protein